MIAPHPVSAFTSTQSPRTAFVALIDVLGFKGRLQSTELKELIEGYRHLMKMATESRDVAVVSPTNVEVWSIGLAIFSDTILLAANDGWNEVQTLISAAAQLMNDALQWGWPLRGAIAHGSCVLDLEERTFVGQPIVDAHLAEESQEWIGIGLHSSVLNHTQLGSKIPSLEDVIRYPVPVKCGASKIEYAVHWGPYSSGAVSSLARLQLAAKSCRTRRKYEATMKYLKTTCQDMHALS